MESALQHQSAGRVDEAARNYREVLARAPSTHDALHMLGVIELVKQNLDEAERLIREASALRAPYPAIEHNLQLVHDARVARIRAQPEELAARALPILAELALGGPDKVGEATPTRSASASIHLIGRVAGDDDEPWLLRRLVDVLGAECTALWTTDDDAPSGVGAVPVRKLDAAIGALPRGGTHVFVGLDIDCTEWVARSAADRVVAIPVGVPPTACLDGLRAIAHDGARRVELVLPSRAMAARFGAGHAVLAPPIGSIESFDAPRKAKVYGEWSIEEPSAWPVGICGQDRHNITEPADLPFVRSIGAIAGRLHIHDPGRLRYALGADRNVCFFAHEAGSDVAFLSTLRCYVHRVGRWWNEGLARELFSAMALGLPVLCPRDSMYAEYFDDGVDGLLYGSAEEASARLRDLRRAPAFAASIGGAARAKAARLFDSAAIAAGWAGLMRVRTPPELVAGIGVVPSPAGIVS